MNRPLAAALSVLALTLLATGQQPKVLAPHRPIAPKLPDSAPKTGPLRSMVGGLWMIDANFKSTIHIKNSVEIAPVTVTPILWLSNGKKVTLADVTLEPSGVASVSVNDGLNANGISPWATLNGYVEIQYKWPWDPLCVTVTSVDTVHSVIFTNGLRPFDPMNPSAKALHAKAAGAQIMEGMWWKQNPQVTGFVALSNTSSEPVKAQLKISDSSGKSIAEHSVTVSSHGTKTINLDELSFAGVDSGGLEVTYAGKADQLLLNGGLENPATGYSASIPFASAPSVVSNDSTTYAELGLMSGAADPMMNFPVGTTFTPYSLLRNIGSKPATITPSVYSMQSGTAHSTRLPPIQLQAYETQNLDVMAILATAGLPNFNGSFNLVFDVKGSVLMASGSVDQKNTYVFEVMPTSAKESASKSIGYWSTKDGDDTMITLWNPADEPQDFIYTVFFSGGHYELPAHLGPRATRMFNMSEIIQTQVPDKDGNVIPPAAQEGSAQISGPDAENQGVLVSVDAGVYNVRKATCAYTCINCNGTVSFVFLGGSPIPYHGNSQASLKATWNTGKQYDLTSVSTWSTTNTNVATVSKGLAYGAKPGDVFVNGEDVSEPWAGQSCGAPPAACPVDTGVAGSGGGPVQPFISGVIPDPLTIGSSGALNITGVGFSQFSGTPTVQFDGTGITVTAPSVLNDGSILATYSVSSSTLAGSQNVTVSFPSGPDGGAGATSNPYAVSIVAPAPAITGGNTVWWFNGQNPAPSAYATSVTLSSSAGSSTSWSVSQPDAKVTLSSGTGAQITITSTGTHFSSTSGDISITATANGSQSAPFTMTAKTPWELVPLSSQTFCNSSPNTYSTEIAYNLVDNFGNVMSTDVTWNESVGTAACENGSNWCQNTIQTQGGFTNPLTDILEPPLLNSSPTPVPTPTCNGQGSGTTRYRSIPQTIYVGTSGSGGVKAQSDTLGYYKDHGQHDSIQSPARPPQ